jgi:hypothetical protein
MRMENATYLGVEVSPMDAALRTQLKFGKDNVGLVVDSIDPDGPAAKAGLQRYDIVTKLNDQLLVNPAQLQSLIRRQKSGDEVQLTLVRQGETKTVAAKLGEKEQPVTPQSGFVGMTGGPGGIMSGSGGMMSVAPGAGRHQGWGNSAGSRTIAFRDAGMALTITAQNGKLTLDAKSAEGKQLYNGAIDTEEDRNQVPADVRKRLDALLWNHLRSSLLPGEPGLPGSNAGELPENPKAHPGQ